VNRIDMDEESAVLADLTEDEEYDWSTSIGFDEEEYEPSQQPR
jgi:hypothetical protein